MPVRRKGNLKRFTVFTVLLFLVLLFIENRFHWDRLPEETPLNQHIAHPDYLREAQLANQHLEKIPKKLGVPSFSVAVGNGQEIIWSAAAGYANVKEEKKASHSTQYRLGSSSKPLTSIGFATLFRDGAIGLDEDVSKIISTNHEKEYGFTPRQLLSHTAGFPDYPDLDLSGFYYTLCNCTEFDSVEESLRVFDRVPLLYEPGTEYHYNSFDFVYVSRLIELITDSSFEAYMQKEIFEPLAMKSTVASKGSLHEQEAVFYERSGNKVRPWRTLQILPTRINLSYKIAGGGFLSTPEDMVKFGNALISNNGLLIDDEIKAHFFKPYVLANGEVNNQNYALGFRVYDNYSHENLPEKRTKYRIIHHGGVSKGAMNFFVMFPDDKLVINASINAKADNFQLLWDEVMTLVGFFMK